VLAPAPPAVKAEPRPADPMALAEAARARGDNAEMVAQLRRAAAQGNAEANFRLGDVYATGRGQPQNNLQAYVYFSLAALDGHAAAGPRRDALTALLQPAEIQQADRLVRERRRSSNERKG
jgi:TPR repeat protein